MGLPKPIYAALPAMYIVAGLFTILFMGSPISLLVGFPLAFWGLYIWKRRDDSRAMRQRCSTERNTSGGDQQGSEPIPGGVREGGDYSSVGDGGIARSLNDADEPCLIVLTGELAGAAYRLGPGTTLVGSFPGCDITLPGKDLSRLHARIDFNPRNGAILKDLGSASGTWVEGERVDTQYLTGGEEVQLGTELIVRFELCGNKVQESLRAVSRGDMQRVSG